MRPKTQRGVLRTVKLYDWLWKRATKGKAPLFININTNAVSLTERSLLLLAPQIMPIHTLYNSALFRKAVLEIIKSN